MPRLSWQNSGIVPQIKAGLSHKRAKVDSDPIEPGCVRVAVTHEDSPLNHDPASLAGRCWQSCRSVSSTQRTASAAAAHDSLRNRRVANVDHMEHVRDKQRQATAADMKLLRIVGLGQHLPLLGKQMAINVRELADVPDLCG